MYQCSTAPEGLGRVLMNSFKLLKSGFLKVLPFALIATIVAAELSAHVINDHNFLFNTWRFYQLNWGHVLRNLMIALTVSWCYAGIYYQYVKLMHNEKASLKQAAWHSLIYFLPLFITMIFYFFIVVLGLVLFLIPGIFIGVSCALAPAIAATETLNPFTAMSESYKLIIKHWWRTLLLPVLPFVVLIIIGIFANSVAQAMFVKGVDDLKEIIMVRTLISSICGFFFMMWFFALNLTVLHDLRLRAKTDPKEVPVKKSVDDSLETFLEENS